MRPDASETLRRHLIEALEKRAAGHDGELRRVLEQKIAHLPPPKGVRVDTKGVDTKGVRVVSVSDAAESRPLPQLTKHLADAAAARSAGRRSTYPELPALDDFQAIWSALRSESQWRQSLVDAPENAGPLNSSALVHRAIALMRDLSPGYLQHFLAYVDDLSWLGQIEDGGPAVAKDAQRPATIGKRARKRTTKARDLP